MQTIYRTTCWGESFAIRADWRQAKSPIERQTEEGWEPTGIQVAQCWPHEAMRNELYQCCSADYCPQDDPVTVAEIQDALDAMEAE